MKNIFKNSKETIPKIKSKTDLILFLFLSRWPYRLLIVVLALISAVCGLLVPFFQRSFVETLLMTDLLAAAAVAFISLTSVQITNYLGNKEALICQSDLAN